MSTLDAIDLVELPDSTDIAIGQELKIFAITQRKELTEIVQQLSAANSLARITVEKNGKPTITNALEADIIIIECRVIEIFADVQTIREIRLKRPLVPIIAIGVNHDPEFSMMILQSGVTIYLPMQSASEVLNAQILGIHSLSESTRLMEIKNNELIDTMRSLRKAHNDLKAQTEQRIQAERDRAEADHRAELNKQTKVILDNLREGFFSVDRSLVVGEATSKACAKIFGGEIAGKKIGTSALNLKEEKERYIKLGFDQIFDNLIPACVTVDTIPRLVSTTTGRVIEMTYTVVCDDKDEPEKIIIVAADITQQLVEKKKMKLRDDQNRRLLAILRSAETFRNFVDDFKKEIITLKSSDNMIDIKRSFHTIKGNSAAFGLSIVSKRVQLVENRLATMSGPTADEKTKICRFADIVADDLKSFLSANHEILQVNYDGEKKDQYILDELVFDDLREIAKVSPIDIKDRLELFLEVIKQKPVLHSIYFFEARIKRLAAKLGKKIEFRMRGKDMRVNYDLLSGVIQNLIHPINNACDHGIETPEERAALGKQPTGYIEIAFESPEETYVRIIVSDDGRGIDAKKLAAAALARGAVNKVKLDAMNHKQLLELVFLDNVSTADQVSDISGRGIGMSALKAEVSKLNGTIDITTTPGGGSSFRIDIPYPQKLRKLKVTRKAPKILVCDDEEDLLEVYTDMFTSVGFEVVSCTNGLDAILELSRSHFDVLVTDLRMPGLDAQEVISKVRKVRNDNDLMPILMVSGYVTQAIREALSVYPELIILEKPIESSEIIAHVRRIMGEEQ